MCFVALFVALFVAETATNEQLVRAVMDQVD
jgi:hypothetical protein